MCMHTHSHIHTHTLTHTHTHTHSHTHTHTHTHTRVNKLFNCICASLYMLRIFSQGFYFNKYCILLMHQR